MSTEKQKTMWKRNKHPMLGKKHTKESREKNRNSHIGLPNLKLRETIKRLGLTKGEKNPRFGIVVSEGTKKKIKNSNYHKDHKKEKSSNWQGGISKEPYSFNFDEDLKEKIRKKFGFRCQQCFRHQDELFMKNRKGEVVNYRLAIHHIDYNKKNNEDDNLIPLCRTYYGQTHFNRNQWINYFQEKFICS